jgi:hypothetical protein
MAEPEQPVPEGLGGEPGSPGSVDAEREKWERPPLAIVVHIFQESLDAIRELHEEVGPAAAEMDEKRMSPEVLTAVRGLPPEKRERLAELMKVRWQRSGQSQNADSASDPECAEPSSNRDEENAKTDDSAAPATAAPPSAAEEDSELAEIFREHREAAAEYLVRLHRAFLGPDRELLMRQSLLTMCVGAFEVLVGSLFAEKYARHPNALGDQKEFSLGDLASFDTVEGARQQLIDDRVDNFLRRSFENWMTWFANASGLGLTYETLSIDPAVVREVFQRRHIIIHNAGRVSRRYLQNTDHAGEPPPLGEVLRIDASYVDRAIDELDTVGNLLAVGAWAKLLPDEEQLALIFLSERSQHLMFNRRWLAVAKSARSARRSRHPPSAVARYSRPMSGSPSKGSRAVTRFART